MERMLFSLLAEISRIIKEQQMVAKNNGATYNKYKIGPTEIEIVKEDLRQLVKFVAMKGALAEKHRQKNVRAALKGSALDGATVPPHHSSSNASSMINTSSSSSSSSSSTSSPSSSSPSAAASAASTPSTVDGFTLARNSDAMAENPALNSAAVAAAAAKAIAEEQREAEIRERQARAAQARAAEAEMMRQQVEAMRGTENLLAKEVEDARKEMKGKLLEAEEVEGRAAAMEGTEAVIKGDLEHKVLRLRELHRQFPSLRKMGPDGSLPPQSPRIGLGGLGFFSAGQSALELAAAAAEWKHLHEEVPLMREQLMWTQMSLTKSRQRLPELYQVRQGDRCWRWVLRGGLRGGTARARLCVWVRACVRVRARARARVCVCVCVDKLHLMYMVCGYMHAVFSLLCFRMGIEWLHILYPVRLTVSIHTLQMVKERRRRVGGEDTCVLHDRADR